MTIVHRRPRRPLAPAPRAQDAYTRRVLARTQAIQDRVVAGFGKKVFIGEFAIPHRGPNYVPAEAPQWANLLACFLDAVPRMPGMVVTYWQAGRASSDYYASPAKLDPVVAWGNNGAGTGINTEYAPGPVLTPRMSPTIGVNVAGYEYIMDQYGTDEAMPSYGIGNWITTAADFDYLQARGVKLIRLPLMWPRLQPHFNDALDTARLADVDGMIQLAAARGIKVILDNHQYAKYTDQTTFAVTTLTPSNAGYLSDFWTRMGTWIAADATRRTTVFAYDLMNEPVRAGSASDWQQIANTVSTAVRAADPTGPKIIAPGWFYSGVESFLSDHTTNYAPNCDYYGVHMYWNYAPQNDPSAGRGGEGGLSGNYCASYSEEVASAVAAGF